MAVALPPGSRAGQAWRACARRRCSSMPPLPPLLACSASGRKPQHKPHHGKKRFGASIGITKFATAGSKQYDKREKQEKERALNAAKVNAYRKLKKRLGDKMEPRSLPTHAQVCGWWGHLAWGADGWKAEAERSCAESMSAPPGD